MRKMVDYAQAVSLILDGAQPVSAETLSLHQALGRYLAEPLRSHCDLPGFANAAMDGYSLSLSGDETLPAGHTLPIAGSQAAGDEQRPGGVAACEIMTGARMPEGHNSVVMVEQTEPCTDADGQQAVRLLADVRCGQNVRLAGEDVGQGEIIVAAGQVLTPAAMALASAVGIAQVRVRRRLRVGVICTGRELVDDPDQVLSSGEIRNSNGPYLAAILAGADLTVLGPETVSDDVAAFLRCARAMLDQGCDVLLTTGAVSMGRYDFVPQALTELGGEAVFHKARIRPGKPVFHARLPGGVGFFGLPGNPISAAVGERFFVRPLLRRLRGQADEHFPMLPLLNRATGKEGLQVFLKACVRATAQGLGVEILDGQQSFKLRPLVQANAWAILPQATAALDTGERVAVASLLGEPGGVFDCLEEMQP